MKDEQKCKHEAITELINGVTEKITRYCRDCRISFPPHDNKTEYIEPNNQGDSISAKDYFTPEDKTEESWEVDFNKWAEDTTATFGQDYDPDGYGEDFNISFKELAFYDDLVTHITSIVQDTRKKAFMFGYEEGVKIQVDWDYLEEEEKEEILQALLNNVKED